MRLFALVFPCIASASCCGQPLIDLFQANALQSLELSRREVSASLPVKLDSMGQLTILDPYWVQWRSVTEGARYEPALDGERAELMEGIGAAATWVKPMGGAWKFVAVGLLRYHWLEDQRRGDLQPGGAALVARAFNPRLTLRMGAYANHEAFGWFMLPLLGVDWRINERTNLYGTLPGSLTYERKSRSWLHWGASFRAYTTSFGVRGGDYRRINENPAGLYADWCIGSGVVLRTEAGWCFFRRFWGGSGDPLFTNAGARERGYADHDLPDAPYVRMVLAYRLRLDKARVE